MPWIGELNGKSVIPESVDDREKVVCPDCKGPMVPRGPTADGKARHFMHTGSLGGNGGGVTCGGGESDVHRRYKSHAVSRLRALYDGKYELAKPEYPLGDKKELSSGVERREADALLEFTEQHDKFGNGLIIEVQYRNAGKEIGLVESDYLELGYSVLWADEDDFTEDRCTIDEDEIRQRTVSVWPNAVPPTRPEKSVNDQGELDMQAFRNHCARWFHAKHRCTPMESLDRVRTALGIEIDTPKTKAKLPPDWYDQRAQDIWKSQPWSNLFTGPREDRTYRKRAREATAGQYSPIRRIPFIAFLKNTENHQTARYRQQLTRAWRKGQNKHSEVRDGKGSPSDPDPPPNPFDDIQCRECGMYWGKSKRLEECPDCGDSVNLEWNLNTDRISRETYNELA